MLLDLFNEDNSITVNLKAIKLFGLNTAVYLSEIITIYKKAVRKNKIDDGYFKVDRNYIFNKIDLSVEDQLICDANLMKTSILKKSLEDPNKINFNVNLYLSFLSNDEMKLLTDVRKQMKVNKPKGVKGSQRQIWINGLKDSITCSNYELLTALRNWVDGVYANPKGFLSKASIKVFQDTLNNYTQGDLDLALRIVQIATVQGYRDCSWAINVYEKDEASKKKSNQNKIRNTIQQVATKDDVDDSIMF